MGVRFFNTLSRAVEPFAPMDPAGRRVGMYCCGPTVYDLAHIGNFRTFLFADLVRRYLEFRGYEVRHVMNITDVEDKIIARVRQTGGDLRAFTQQYEAAFFEDLATLHCRHPHLVPRATEHIGAMIELIQQLQARGLAYTASDGSVYFSIAQYRAAGKRYGQLVNLDLEHLRPGDRVAADDYGKEAVADFALWKAHVADDGAVSWPSPWGPGRPGWHIECSAMSMQLLGASFDLHLGGEDLMFPHHEDEIAQSEGAGRQTPGQPFVRYWLHGAHLLVEGRKMSKSLGNFFTLRDLLKKGFSGREVRYLLLTAHYRESFNFTLDGLRGARSALDRIAECLERLRLRAGPARAAAEAGLIERFIEAMDDDLNVSKAWAVVFDWVRDTNRRLDDGRLSADDAAAAIAAWIRTDSVFGLGERASVVVDPELESLLQERQAARRAKDFKRADEIREILKSRGWTLEDTPSGPRLKPLACIARS
jgi:cysteinyl-tRNA synthetase